MRLCYGYSDGGFLTADDAAAHVAHTYTGQAFYHLLSDSLRFSYNYWGFRDVYEATYANLKRCI